MNDIVIVSGVRTAVGSFGGSLKDISAQDLGALRLTFHQRTAFRQDVQRLDGFCNAVILPHSRVRLQQTVGNVAVDLLHIAEDCMRNFHVILLHRCCSLNCANALAASTVSPF